MTKIDGMDHNSNGLFSFLFKQASRRFIYTMFSCVWNFARLGNNCRVYLWIFRLMCLWANLDKQSKEMDIFNWIFVFRLLVFLRLLLDCPRSNCSTCKTIISSHLNIPCFLWVLFSCEWNVERDIVTCTAKKMFTDRLRWVRILRHSDRSNFVRELWLRAKSTRR